MAHRIKAGQGGSWGAPADIDEEPICFEHFIADTNLMRVFKARMAFIDRQLLSALQPLFYAFAGATYHSVFALFDFLHINSDRAVDHHAILRGASRDMSCARACDQRLRRDAAVVDTGATEPLTLDDRHFHSCACQPDRERWSRLPSANDDRVIRRYHQIRLRLRLLNHPSRPLPRNLPRS